MVLENECSAAEIGSIVAQEPALGLRVLSLVNSSAFGLRRRVGEVQQAVSLIGLRGLKNLALSLVVSDMAPMTEEGKVLLANSIRRAIACQMVGDAMGTRETDSYFTTGLFLDVGLLGMARENLELAGELARSPSQSRVLLEQARGRKPHPVHGSELAERYRLPEDSVAAIAHHHDASAPEDPLARACWLAEKIAGVYEGGDVVEARRQARDAAEQIGVSDEALDRILRELPVEVSASASAFDRDLGEQPDIDALVENANRQLVEMNHQYENVVRELERLIKEKETLETELRQANARLSELATTDELTQLPNKRAFQDALSRDLSRAARDGTALSLIVIDVDHFKKFNDTWGHSAGDSVLRAVGKLLGAEVRHGDIPGRYGGEEFVVVLPNTPSDGAFVVAERIRERLEAMPVEHGSGQTLHVTASFGVATVRGPRIGAEAQTLFERADAALYEAKGSGRNRVCVSKPHTDSGPSRGGPSPVAVSAAAVGM